MTIPFHVFRRCSLSILAAVLMAAVLSPPLTSHAQEQRCTELGGNCICSEPMNTSSFTLPPGSADFGIGFADGGTRKCAYLGIPSTVGEIPAASRSNYFMSNAASTVNALTNTGNPAFVFSGREGNTGALLFGHSDLPTSNQVRVALRWYRYYSPTFEFGIGGGSGGCQNSGKEAVWQMWGGPTGLGGVITTNSGEQGWSLYSFGGFTPLPDCCDVAPGFSAIAPTVNWANHRGRWFRYEYVVTNTNGPVQFQLYVADVTRGVTRLNNGIEFVITDSRVTCGIAPYPAGCGGVTTGWTSAMVSALIPPAAIRAINIDGFRRDVCTGFAAYSYMMGASWSTNAGQRIGPAREIEGGPGVAPASPSGLRVQ